MLAERHAPDVFWGGNMADYVSRGVVMDITDRVKSDPVLSKADYFIQPQEESRATINGKWYGIGSCWVIHHLYDNTETLQKAGVEHAIDRPGQGMVMGSVPRERPQADGGHRRQAPRRGRFRPRQRRAVGRLLANLVAAARCRWCSRTAAMPTPPTTRSSSARLPPIEAMQRVADLANVHHVAPLSLAMERLNLTGIQMLASQKLGILVDGSWLLQDIAKQTFTAWRRRAADDEEQRHRGPGAYAYDPQGHQEPRCGLEIAGLPLVRRLPAWPDQGRALAAQPHQPADRGRHRQVADARRPPRGATSRSRPTTWARHRATTSTRSALARPTTIITSALDPVWVGKASVEQALKDADAIAKAEAVLAKARESLG